MVAQFLKFSPSTIYNFGDIVYNNDTIFFVDKNNYLLKNINFRYLEIPFSITKHLKNSYNFYKNVLLNLAMSNIAINLKYNDTWLIKKFGNIFNPKWRIIAWFNNGHFNRLWISFNRIINKNFGSDCTSNDIIGYYNGLKKIQVSTVFSSLEKIDIHSILPPTWNYININHSYTLYGPKDDYKILKNNIKKYKLKNTYIINLTKDFQHIYAHDDKKPLIKLIPFKNYFFY